MYVRQLEYICITKREKLPVNILPCTIQKERCTHDSIKWERQTSDAMMASLAE